jgi:hypothetical protein
VKMVLKTKREAGANRPVLGAWAAGIFLAALLITGCLHVRHDYEVDVHGTLVDGLADRPIAGLHVTVKAGEQVVYDGHTDDEGALDFSYRGTLYRNGREVSSEESSNPELSVLFQIEVERFGMVEIPVTIGGKTNVLALGNIQLRPTGE